jgi:hypothetical protein
MDDVARVGKRRAEYRVLMERSEVKNTTWKS